MSAPALRPHVAPSANSARVELEREELASHLSARDAHVIPLRLTDCQLPLRLDARVSLDFTDQTGWEREAARLRHLDR